MATSIDSVRARLSYRTTTASSLIRVTGPSRLVLSFLFYQLLISLVYSLLDSRGL